MSNDEIITAEEVTRRGQQGPRTQRYVCEVCGVNADEDTSGRMWRWTMSLGEVLLKHEDCGPAAAGVD